MSSGSVTQQRSNYVTGHLTSALRVRSNVKEEMVLVDVCRESGGDVGILELQGHLRGVG